MTEVLKALFSPALVQFLAQSNVLVVGVGGIGCELLKQIVKYEWKSIHLVDLDSIEISNLNRQFLFRSSHKGESKAHTARLILSAQYPSQHLISHQHKVQAMPIHYFKQFSLIFSCLDNVEAREYLNRIAITLEIPLVDSGSMGFKGQATLIRPPLTKCYSCRNTRVRQKQFPVCTIRREPTKDIHCVVYSKMVYEVLFTQQDNELADMRPALLAILDGQADTKAKILHLMQEITAIEQETLCSAIADSADNSHDFSEQSKQQVGGEQSLLVTLYWSLHSLLRQHHNLLNLDFDKDNDLIIKCIAALTSLRCLRFNIQPINEFKTKEMAGNIVPAISSTNSIAAALQVDLALKYLNNSLTQKEERIKDVYTQNTNKKVNFMFAERFSKDCLTCSPQYRPAVISCPFLRCPFSSLLSLFKHHHEVCIMIDNSIVYDKNDDMDEQEIRIQKKQENKSVAQLLKDVGCDQLVQFTVEIYDTNRVQFYVCIDDEEMENEQFSVSNPYEGLRQGVDIAEFQQKVQEKEKESNNQIIELSDSELGEIDQIAFSKLPPKNTKDILIAGPLPPSSLKRKTSDSMELHFTKSIKID